MPMIATTLEKNECLTEEFFERFQNTLSALVSNEEFKKAQQYPVVVTGGLKIDTFAFQRWVDKKYLYVVETLYDNQGFKIQLVNVKMYDKKTGKEYCQLTFTSWILKPWLS